MGGERGWAAVAALCAAMAYGAGAVLQHQAARRSATGRDPDLRALARLLRVRRWLAGSASHGLGLGLHVLALTLGPVALVQPVQVSSLLWALPAEALARRARPTLRQVAAAAQVVVGIVVFLWLAEPGASRRSLDPTTGTALILATLTVICGLGLAARPLPAGGRAAVWGTLAGGGYAVSAVLLSSVTAPAGGHRMAALGLLAGALAVGAVSLLTCQAAYQTAHLGAALPALTVVNPAVAVLLGAALLGEPLVVRAPAVMGMALALVCVTAGVAALARPEAASPHRPGRAPTGTAALGACIAAGAVVGTDWALDPDDTALTRLLLVLVAALAGRLVSPALAGVAARNRGQAAAERADREIPNRHARQ